MNDIQRVLNKLREQRRDAQRGMEKAQKAGNQIAEHTCKREIRRLDGEIANLEEK